MALDYNHIYDVWARKTPLYQKEYEKKVIKILVDFGKGTNEASEAKGKILGAAYEVLIMAFFIGLYSNKKVPFGPYDETKDCGQPIQYWGNLDSKKLRHAYPRLREYIFIALVAKTPSIDWIELDKGNLTVNEVVSLLMDTMEEYINYGLSILLDKIKEDEGFFYNNNSFLNLFMEITDPDKEKSKKEDNEDLEELI
jgi:hypothetical protein